MGELWEAVQGLAAWFYWNHTDRERLNAAGISVDDWKQQSFITMTEAVKTFRPDRGGFPAWYVFYLRRQYRDLTRSPVQDSIDREISGTDDLTLADTIPAPDDGITECLESDYKADLQKTVLTALEAVRDDKARKAVQLVDLDGLTRSRAAAAAGMSVPAISAARARGFREMRENPALRAWVRDNTDYFRAAGVHSLENILIHAETMAEAAAGVDPLDLEAI